ncbi:MAG: hypothetical protein ACRD3L_07560, partial [Terriglobales bacterium]
MSPRVLARDVDRAVRLAVVGHVLVFLMVLSSTPLADAASVHPVARWEALSVISAANINFFVATNGKDSWSGKLAAPNDGRTDGPFASLARAQVAVQNVLKSQPASAIVVLVREGAYYLPLSPTNPGTLNFTPSDSGTASAPVIWENYPNEAPVVNGGFPVSGWSHKSGSLWQVQLPARTKRFEYLFYNGERRVRSRLQSAAAGTGYYMSGGSCISSQSQQVVSTSLCNLGTFLRVAAEIPPTGANATCPAYSDGPDSKCM